MLQQDGLFSDTPKSRKRETGCSTGAAQSWAFLGRINENRHRLEHQEDICQKNATKIKKNMVGIIGKMAKANNRACAAIKAAPLICGWQHGN